MPSPDKKTKVWEDPTATSHLTRTHKCQFPRLEMIVSDAEPLLGNIYISPTIGLFSQDVHRCYYVCHRLIYEIYAPVQGTGHLWGPGGRSSVSTKLVLSLGQMP